eukprot:gnl/MRDRNA2_/MRDRNA2_96351_c0_seq1.p1 gnl/MRDRNA2_/MRDRNA2_96351_c0~~gnl/MRDRNA2_/MRDRNA2_96351_c0_seq1.p1  ORF type:complete len:357 (+),score=72.02 gnl/MRDRNA2_/MRDRNA2_96351_c0_seq1:105-1175(+)
MSSFWSFPCGGRQKTCRSCDPSSSTKWHPSNFEVYNEESSADVKEFNSNVNGAIQALDRWVAALNVGEKKTPRKVEMRKIFQHLRYSGHDIEDNSGHLPRTDHEWIMFRRQHVARMTSTAQKSVEASSGSWLQSASHVMDENAIRHHQKLDACKERYRMKMDAILHLASITPLKMLPAEKAIEECASSIGVASMDVAFFTEIIESMVQKNGISSITAPDIVAVFNALDIDGTGYLSHEHWISAIPIFFKGSVDVSKVIFKALDADSSGDLNQEEFARFTTPIIHMLLPPEDVELREKMKEKLAANVFEQVDVDESGLLSADEFAEWARNNSLASEAFQALEEFVTGKRVKQAEYVR